MPRPFYVIGHNTNSMEEIRGGLASGLNAFEVDIQDDDDGNLFINHEPVRPTPRGFRVPPRLPEFFGELAALVGSSPGADISLLILDCKVSSGNQARRLLDEVHEHFPASLNLPIIYSVPKVAAARTFFPPISGLLHPRELLMVDEETSVKRTAKFFSDSLDEQRSGYGNGSAVFATPDLPSQMDAAVAFRAIENVRFVYAWVVNRESDVREFARIGVDGVLVDGFSARTLVQTIESGLNGSVRMAKRSDDAFAPDSSLVLQILTRDASNAGTDAVVTFTLQPTNGEPAISRRVNGFPNQRFERNTLSFVTFVGVELPPERIQSITVSHDGAGNAPDWSLGSVRLRRRGANDRLVVFNADISAGQPVTRPVPP